MSNRTFVIMALTFTFSGFFFGIMYESSMDSKWQRNAHAWQRLYRQAITTEKGCVADWDDAAEDISERTGFPLCSTVEAKPVASTTEWRGSLSNGSGDLYISDCINPPCPSQWPWCRRW